MFPIKNEYIHEKKKSEVDIVIYQGFRLQIHIHMYHFAYLHGGLRKTPCFTMFESENEWQKIEQVPIPLPRASRNFSNIKTRNNFFFYNWTSEIIPFICFGKQRFSFEMSKVTPFIVTQLCYNELWPFSH